MAFISGPAQGDTDNDLLKKILLATLSGGGGGGGGGGAVTVADGSDVAQGAKADARATDSTSSWTVIALLKGIWQNTNSGGGGGAVTSVDGGIVTIGAKADAAATDSTSAWTVVALLKGIFAKLAGTLTVGGNIGGKTTIIKDTSAVTASAYSAGNAVGGKRTLANALLAANTGILQAVTLLDRANQKANMTLFIFDADPTNATITDHSAFVFSIDDLKVIAQVNISASDYTTTNSKALATIGGLNIPLKAVGTTLYAALVTSGTPTFAATTDVQLEVGILQD